ncbi:MAG: hypothetical protein IJF07_01005 [Lachnospiraceae bacterium]|nr:hypothetical protein [Lachnospiraceae bacterium]
MKKFLILLSTLLMVAGLIMAKPNTYEVHALSEEEAAWVEEARIALAGLLAEREVMALVYLSDEYAVKEAPAEDSNTVVTVFSGQTVQIEDVVINDSYEAWVYASFFYNGAEYSGYINRNHLACSDERFLEWEANYGMNPGAVAMYAVDGQTGYVDIEQFPASYQPALLALKEKHPNWTFVKSNTRLDWNGVIANQLTGGKSLVYKTFPDYAKEGLYDGGNWYYASEAILKIYMDPRNSLTEEAVFQFEQLTYNETYHTEEAVKGFLENTFMNSSQNAPGTVLKFHKIFWAIGAEEGRKVSPFHLAARVLQEQGQGTSPLISGTYAGYEGYYNYFNVGATGTSDKQVIENGLKYAKEKNWYNAYYSILGGADVISANYIKKGQDTLYLQKFNVGPGNHYALHTHQYMQNIAAPTSEAKSIKNLYEQANSLDSTFVFKIPVYENMPETPCAEPAPSMDVVLNVPEGYSDATVYLDGVAYTAAMRDGKYVITAPNGEAKTAVAFRYNENGVPMGMYVWTLSYENNAYVATAQPELADLLSYHGFSIRITGKPGIRFKTGISTEVRNRLTAEGINGYRLKEYGTLVMNNKNRGTYPMIKGGEKVLSGMSYGMNANGGLEDKIYETVNNRYRYTSVLVGQPASQYKTEYAFGGYIILEKDGVETTIYGPVVAKSIYSLAQQVLNMGSYEPGSAAETFLKTLIADADAYEQQSGAMVSGGDAAQ